MEPGLNRGPDELRLYEEGFQASGQSILACVSDQEEVILRKAEILFRGSSEMGHVTVDGLLDVMHMTSF